MDFISYVIFIALGALVGAVLGRRVMRFLWGEATVAQRENVGYWIALALACVYMGARRYW